MLVVGISLALLGLASGEDRQYAEYTKKQIAAYEKAHPGVARIGGEVAPPKLNHRVNPDWDSIPIEKRKYRWPIMLLAVVTPAGDVHDPQVVSPPQPALDPVVLAAIRQWRYEPAVQAGKPVAVFLTTTVTF